MKKRFARPLSMAISVAMMSCMLYLVPLSNYVKVDALMPYQDISLSFEERAADLVSRMTLSEKEKQIANSAPAITRLGVPSYNYWNEGLHGVANINQGENATSFPYSLGMAASWDRELVREVMTATADEARGFNQLRNKGLTYWSPTINLARDPRWGRNHESFGEDPYLTAQIGQSFVEGFQGDHEKYIKIVSTPKHYAANNSEYNRHKGTSNIDDRNLREYYTRAFRDISLNTNVGSVMSAYNRVNEVPASAHRYLLNDLLRKTWGFTGFIVSDCGAINNMYETFNHNWRPSEDNNRFTAVRVGRRYVDGTRLITPPGATALSLMAGTDMDCGSVYPNNGVAAVNNGLMSEHDMDIALVRIFTARMKLGEFDPTEDVPYRDSAYSYANQITSKKHKQLAEDSADQSIVLLKNQKARSADTRPILPLDKNKKNVVLVGPSQIATNYILGAYSGIPFPEDISTPRQGIANVLGLSDESQVTYLTGGSFRGTVVSQVRDVNLVKDGENVRTLRPADHSSAKSRGIVYQLNENRFGYIEPDSVIVYENIDITEIDSIAIETRGEGGTAQFYMYSETGSMMVASTSIGGSTPNDTIYNLSTANIGSTGGYNVGELHVVFVLPEQQVNLSPSDQNTIANADAVIVAIGSQGGDSSEGLDRGFLSMRRMQGELAKAVWELNPNTVVHIQSVGMLDLSEFVDDVPAILWCAYNGQAQGNAMARVIFGDANPTAKLPFTWYADEDQLPTIDDYHIRGDEFEGKTHNGWTYQYFTGDTTYPFGHGLTYSSFEYTNTTIDKTTVTPNDTVTVTVDVENTGGVDSAEIVQMYVVPPVNDRISRPAKQLKGFDKVKLAVGEKKTVTITYDLADMYFWDEDLQRNTHDQGDYIFQIGASSDDIRFEETVSLYGIIDERLLVVGAHPDRVILDASKPGARINSGIVASLRDDRWLDLARSDVTVTYTSGDESVAIVDGKGIVTPTGEGVTTITAAVSFGGDTMTADFPVVVFMDDEVVLTGISVDGKLLRGFEGRVFSYDYAVPFAQTNIPA
ncbi:MAG: glycoside hydrolase family 3 C-terminal domain-containing protein, partial [Oscillospiraceae bacterium]|nr:glycoside hydrolase family 3 C-terminal domain-containing protein [Oscillospiraceae bacterium]